MNSHFDLEYYAVHRRRIKVIFETRPQPPDRLERALSEYAAASQCHIVAVFLFYAEAFGMTEQIQAKVDKLMRFYRLERVKEPSNESN